MKTAENRQQVASQQFGGLANIWGLFPQRHPMTAPLVQLYPEAEQIAYFHV